MPNFNQTILIGHLTRDPEMQYSKNGKAFVKFTVAVNQGKDKKALFMDCTAFDKTAEAVAQYVKKGSPIFVSGYLNQESWQSEDGQKRTKIVLICTTVRFLERGSELSEAPISVSINELADSDIPF